MENMTTMARGVGRTNTGRGALEKRPGLGRPGRQAWDGEACCRGDPDFPRCYRISRAQSN